MVLDPATTALLVIDMQNDFISPEGYHGRRNKPVGRLASIVPSIRRLVSGLPSQTRRIYIATVREADGSDGMFRNRKLIPPEYKDMAANQGPYLVAGSWGAEITEPLKPSEKDKVIVKNRFSAFYQTNLEFYLRCWGIQTLIFSGVVTEVCVESTIRDAFMRDYDIVLVSDAVQSWDEQHHEATVKLVGNRFGVVMTAKVVLESLFA